MSFIFKLLLLVVAIAIGCTMYQVYMLEDKVEMLKEEVEYVRRTYSISEMNKKEQ